MPTLTWNMQGASASWENKWNVGVLNLMTQLGAEAACLQECGAVPGSAVLQAHNYNGVANLDLYTWGTARTQKYILFYPWDLYGNRCNLAIVSVAPPLNPLLVYPAAAPIWRPVLGAQLGGVGPWCCTLHAISPNGPDAGGLLNALNGLALPTGWDAYGDFNREPDGTFPAGYWVVCPPNYPTYPATAPRSRYDYSVRSWPRAPVLGAVQGLYLSDHLAVAYV